MVQVPPQLAAPGAGIPAFERLIAKFIIMHFRLQKRIDVNWLRQEYQQSLAKIMAAAEAFPVAARQIPVLIPRLSGLEDSSRYYSPAMVLEHVALVDSGVSAVIASLGKQIVPPQAPNTANVKPSPGIAWATAVAQLQKATEIFEVCLNTNFASSAVLPHPWFGPLTAWQWAQFLPIHHGIHLAQLKRMQVLS